MAENENNLAEIPGLRLLALFDALVRRDVDQPGLIGKVALGVDTTWWCADFNESAKTQFYHSRPAANVHVTLTAAEAEDILQSGAIGQGIRLQGDSELFQDFIARYTQKRTWLDIRAT